MHATCLDSSVGRALDWRSKGPRFDPGSGHSFCWPKLLITSIASVTSEWDIGHIYNGLYNATIFFAIFVRFTIFIFNLEIIWFIVVTNVMIFFNVIPWLAVCRFFSALYVQENRKKIFFACHFKARIWANLSIETKI
jgi:hypothetical protein